MSGGSGGGGGGPGGGGFVPSGPVGGDGRRPGGDDKCDILVTLPLSAVQTANAAKVKVGDTLDVRLVTNKNVDTVVVNLPGSNSVVGAVAYRTVGTLIDCIKAGNQYGAKVISKSATSVKVQIARV